MEDRILQELATIKELLLAEQTKREFPERSTELNELASALSTAQGEFEIAHMKGINAFHKSPYEDLAELIKVTRPALKKNGLSVSFSICSYDNTPDILHTELLHTSGQFKASHIRLTPPKNTLEAIKSYNDAVMRMAYKALLCIEATNDDDDGEGAMYTERETVARGTALNRNQNNKDELPETISSLEIREIEKALGGDEEMAEQLLDSYRLRSIADIPKSQFHEILTQILKIKDRRSRAK